MVSLKLESPPQTNAPSPSDDRITHHELALALRAKGNLVFGPDANGQYQTTTTLCHGGDSPKKLYISTSGQGGFLAYCHTKACGRGNQGELGKRLLEAAGIARRRLPQHYQQHRDDKWLVKTFKAPGRIRKEYRRNWPEDWNESQTHCPNPIDKGGRTQCLRPRNDPHKHMWTDPGSHRDVECDITIGNDTDIIYLTEGGKASYALNRAGYNAASWLGGANSIRLVDLRPLHGKHIIAWPDNDKGGLGTRAMQWAGYLLKEKVASFSILPPYDAGRDGADAADCPREELASHLAKAKPYEPENEPGTDEAINTKEEENKKTEIPPREEPATPGAGEEAPKALTTATGQQTPSVPRTGFTSSGAPIKLELEDSVDGIKQGLEHLGVQIRYNKRMEGPEASENGGETWDNLEDLYEAHLRQLLEENCDVINHKNGKTKRAEWVDTRWYRLMKSLQHREQCDPFRDYLEALPAWDGIPRLERMLHNILLADDTPLNAAAGRCFMIGAVARTYKPGTKFDWILTLIGPQGGGKSSFARHLVPSPDFYSSSVDFTKSDKEVWEGCGQAVITEFPEMAGLTGRRMDYAKAFITKETDRFRPAYGHRSIRKDRMWIGIATANPKANGILPHDETGQRRFVCVEVHAEEGQQPIVVEALEADRDQLWAEALYAYRSGESQEFPYELIGDRDAANAKYTKTNEAIEETVNQLTDQGKSMPIGKIVEACGEKPTDQGAQARVRPILIKLGWTQPQHATRDTTLERKDQVNRWWKPPTPLVLPIVEKVVEKAGETAAQREEKAVQQELAHQTG